MTNYTWTDNTMRSGSTCDVDKVADNLMHLKYNAGGLLPVNDLGTKTTSFTLEPNKIDLANITASLTISLPTSGFISGVENKCIVDFSSTVTTGITLPSGSSIKWKGGLVQSTFSTIARNIVEFVTRDNGTTWEAEYKTYGGVLTAFVRPNLSANGTMGGSSFAVSATSENGIYQAYMAVDGSNTTPWDGLTPLPISYVFYNPSPLRVESLSFLNAGDGGVTTAFLLYGSNDGITYTLIGSYTNSVTANSASWSKTISSTEYYKYHKITVTSCNSASYLQITELGINGYYIATS